MDFNSGNEYTNSGISVKLQLFNVLKIELIIKIKSFSNIFFDFIIFIK